MFIVTFNNSPKLEIKQMFINRRLNKQIVYTRAIEYCSDTHTHKRANYRYIQLTTWINLKYVLLHKRIHTIWFHLSESQELSEPVHGDSHQNWLFPRGDDTCGEGIWELRAPPGQARDRKSASCLAPLAHCGGGVRVPLAVEMEGQLLG